MKDAYRKFLIITIVILTSFLAVSGLRKWSGESGLLEFLKNTADVNPRDIESATLATAPPISQKEIPILQQLNSEFTKLAEAVMPSVVSINTAGLEGKKVVDRFGRSEFRTSRVTGQGSGVIISHEGHIITNYHVIANKQTIEVIASNNRVYLAELVGTDPALDIAVIKITSKENLKPLKFGDSDLVREGNMVFAFGNPFNIGKSITNGIISARERSLSDRQGGLLQSSAAINPGYSGGPLVNAKGEVIGINSSIYSSDEKNPGFQGISFSIPSNIVARTFQDIRKRGRPVRGFLGVRMTDLTNYQKAKFGYPYNHGALVQNVGEETPASDAGIKSGDIIMEWNRKKISDFSQLIGLIQRSTIGAEIPVSIWRDKSQLALSVKVAENDTNWKKPTDDMNKIKNPREILVAIGIKASPLNVQDRYKGLNGVQVQQILKDSLADGLLKKDDIIFQVNNQIIHQPEQFYPFILMHAVDKELRFHVIRKGEDDPLKIDLPALNQK